MGTYLSPYRHRAACAVVESLMAEWYTRQTMPDSRHGRARAIIDALEADGFIRERPIVLKSTETER